MYIIVYIYPSIYTYIYISLSLSSLSFAPAFSKFPVIRTAAHARLRSLNKLQSRPASQLTKIAKQTVNPTLWYYPVRQTVRITGHAASAKLWILDLAIGSRLWTSNCAPTSCK